MKSYTVQEINEVVSGKIVGQTDKIISAPEQLDLAKETDISFIGTKRYEKFWVSPKTCAAIVYEDIAIEPGDNRVFIKVKNADLAITAVLELFAPQVPIFAVLGNRVVIGGSPSIKDHTTIADGATLGAGSGVVGNVAAGVTILGYPTQETRDMLKQWVILRKMVADSKK